MPTTETTQKWNDHPIVDGIRKIPLASFHEFSEFLDMGTMKLPDYIWRGQRRDDWVLSSTYDRSTGTLEINDLHKLFVAALRGRRPPHDTLLETDNDIWALGQHHGLSTPLLDWTTSPYAALYFAFYKCGDKQTAMRSVFALSPTLINEYFASSEKKAQQDGIRNAAWNQANEFEIFTPKTDDNPRLVSQGGLFTRFPPNESIESWIRRNCKGVTSQPVLVIFRIPDVLREECLLMLNRMNLNHLSLFPDLEGASIYCNIADEIANYAALPLFQDPYN